MSKLHLLLFALGACVMIYGGYAMIFEGNTSAFIFIAGGFVITAIAAGIIGKAHSTAQGTKGQSDQ